MISSEKLLRKVWDMSTIPDLVYYCLLNRLVGDLPAGRGVVQSDDHEGQD